MDVNFVTKKFKVTGISALMLNNPRMINPRDKYAKALKQLTSKRNKTEDDMDAISKIEFYARWYVNDEGKYCIPASHFWRSLIEAAKENKLGKKIEKNVFINKDPVIDFAGKDKSLEDLFKSENPCYVDVRAVGVKNSKIITTRAIIHDWKCEVEVDYDMSQIDTSTLVEIFNVAGLRYGVGTYRQRYGKFMVE